MPIFSWEAKNKSGEVIRGDMEAANAALPNAPTNKPRIKILCRRACDRIQRLGPRLSGRHPKETANSLTVIERPVYDHIRFSSTYAGRAQPSPHYRRLRQRWWGEGGVFVTGSQVEVRD